MHLCPLILRACATGRGAIHVELHGLLPTGELLVAVAAVAGDRDRGVRPGREEPLGEPSPHHIEATMVSAQLSWPREACRGGRRDLHVESVRRGYDCVWWCAAAGGRSRAAACAADGAPRRGVHLIQWWPCGRRVRCSRAGDGRGRLNGVQPLRHCSAV